MKIKQRHKNKNSVAETTAKTVVGYHVYRSEKESLPFLFWTRVTAEPIPEGSFNDQPDTLGKRYFYKLTQVFEDGSESRPVAAKTNYTDHAGNTFAQNPLKDFAGYNIYRSAGLSVPLEQWERRNRELLPTNEFKDEGVESGEEFYYYVRAVDSLGTESAPSEPVRVIRK